MDVVEGGDATRGAHRQRDNADLRAVEVQLGPADRRLRGGRMDDQDEPAVRYGVGRVLGDDVEVGPFGEAAGRGLTALLGPADLAQRAVQPIVVAVGPELVVQVKIKAVTAQADHELARRRPDRDQTAEFAPFTGASHAVELTDPPATSANPRPTVDTIPATDTPGPGERSPTSRHLPRFRRRRWANEVDLGRLINALRDLSPRNPAFRTAAFRRRCQVPADGYDEAADECWHVVRGLA
ncbi:hypothetical protein [Amycolatopsis sp. MEPSY49]|uniref:hypothetical protein n=1 Tax=Amycolatopsis sp. MEPSY49 TaxID=3151600 RepID=UPI003EFA1B13